jgi:RES domain
MGGVDAPSTSAPAGPRQRRVQWPSASRIVPTRYPAVTLFDRVASAQDFDALYALEALTNERSRQAVGDIDRVPLDQRLYGPGSGPIMAAFTHVNTEGSRFSDGSFGVFYAADDRATAIVETRHHHARFLAATAQKPQHLPMRLYTVAVDAKLHDLRPLAAAPSAVHDPDSYAVSRQWGHHLMTQGSAGVAYRSARRPGGKCVGLFKPQGARACLHAAYLLYAWDGQRFTDVYEKTD